MRSSRSVLTVLSRALLFGALLSGCRQPKDLSVEQLSAVVDAQRATLKPCYDAALKDTPYTHEMRMQVVIHIEQSGSVSSVDVEKGTGLPGMPACVQRTIAAWRFPAASDATDASLPLVFKPEVARPGVPNLPRLDEILGQHRDAKP